ncbi:MAG: hypothetical protein MR549_12260 [Lachnobacterium sp.]|nr:hypothetical protein [Lachnobacterium sp.]
MTVVLLILKIIGIILAALLGTVVLGILLVLFCPFRYRIWGSYHEKPDISIRVAWLMCIFQFRMDITDTQQMYLRILGFRKNLSREEEETNESEESSGLEEESETTNTVENAFDKKRIETNRSDAATVEENSGEEEFRNKEDPKDSIETKSTDLSRKTPEKKISISQKVKRLWEKIKRALFNIKETAVKIKKLYMDPRNKLAFTKLKQSVAKFFRVLHPKKFQLKLKFSTGSPDTTGQLLGVIAMFPIGYRNGWNIVPDFTADAFYADAEFDVRGRVLGISLIKLACSIILDKNCKRLYNKVTSIFK